MGNENWIKITVIADIENLDELCAVMSMLDSGLMIEDYSDVESQLDGVYADLIDEEILAKDRTKASVAIFVPAEKPVDHYTLYIEERTAALGIANTVELSGINEEDWAHSWKQYYKPVRIGEKLVVVPRWETYDEQDGDVIVRMDPGMAFGTGTHETTRLCAQLLEKYVTSDTRMLDVGCGSGILAICASKLGAEFCDAYDIDPIAVRVANENVKDNECTNVNCYESDLLKDAKTIDGGYNVIAANIVADIIIRLSPDISAFLADGGVFIASGIILERSQNVRDAMTKCGFTEKECAVENGWCAIAFEVKDKSFA
jgi:ribosomal protein L11 methyltransferase